MKIKKAEFATSVFRLENCPESPVPEIAFVGRSNVGKSSLINFLLMRKKLARTSGAPGRTQSLNYYAINDEFYFVDLPGYGYAKVGQEVRRKWRKLMLDYVEGHANLVCVIQVIDIRHPPSKDDIWMAEHLHQCDIDWLVVATKADKIAKSKWPKHIGVIGRELGYPVGQVVPVSSVKNCGRDELLSRIANSLSS